MNVKKILFLPVILLIAVFVIFFSSVKAQEMRFDPKAVEYVLPYPGIMPDHPLYAIKKIRDSIMIFLTREPIKKAQTLLLFSDKKIVMAQDLTRRNQWPLSASVSLEAEEGELKIPEILRNSKRQGAASGPELISNLKLSNRKHRQIIETLIKNTPEKERSLFKKSLSVNEEINNKLSSL